MSGILPSVMGWGEPVTFTFSSCYFSFRGLITAYQSFSTLKFIGEVTSRFKMFNHYGCVQPPQAKHDTLHRKP